MNIARFFRTDNPLLLPFAFALTKFSVHMALWTRYGIHRDEYYFFECARRLAWGYVDHAPFVPFLAGVALWLPGSDLFWIRFFPALGGAAAVFVTLLLVRELGGRLYARLLAGLCILFAGVFLRTGGLLHLPSFEPLFWTLATYLALRALRLNRPRLWLAVGLVAGVGLLNKHTMAIWGAGAAVALLLSPAGRAQLRSPWLYTGGLVAGLIFAPNLFWQYANDWPTLEFVGHIGRDVTSKIPASLFLAGQLLYLHPLSALVWIPGLIWLLRRRDKGRLLPATVYLVGLALFLTASGKPYYLAPAYPALFAAGGVALEGWMQNRALPFLRPAFPPVLLAGGLALAPLSLPVLPLPTTDRVIAATLGWVVGRPEDLSGEFHDQYGWREQTEAIAKAFARLSPEDRKNARILAGNYGQAGAVDYYRRLDLDLPPAISGHMNYYFWGPGHAPTPGPTVLIAVGFQRADLEPYFARIEEVARVPRHALSMPGESDLPLFVCRDPRQPLKATWIEFKRFGFR